MMQKADIEVSKAQYIVYKNMNAGVELNIYSKLLHHPTKQLKDCYSLIEQSYEIMFSNTAV